MEYQGKQYSVVQGIDGRWKWSVDLNSRAKSGETAGGRHAAIRMAERTIERATSRKKQRLAPSSQS
jgi:hypothetical protein